MGKNKEKTDRKSIFRLRQIRYALVTSVVLLTILGLSAAFLYRIFVMTEKS
jgi:hypothetical protein